MCKFFFITYFCNIDTECHAHDIVILKHTLYMVDQYFQHKNGKYLYLLIFVMKLIVGLGLLNFF